MKTLIIPSLLLLLSIGTFVFAMTVRAELMTATVMELPTFPYIGPLQPAAPTAPLQGSTPNLQPALL